MATELFKVPQTKRPVPDGPDLEMWSPTKKKKVRETFLNFCDIVLAYTQYNSLRSQDIRMDNNRSPLDSGGSTADSFNSDLAYHSEEDPSNDMLGGSSPGNEVIADDTSFNEVSCFCGKPYMGRPMIECSVCYNWLHLSCVHLRKNNIPETYVCEPCRQSNNHPRAAGVRRKMSHHRMPMVRQRSRMTSYTPAANGVMRPSFAPEQNGHVSGYSSHSPLKSNMAPSSPGNTHAPASPLPSHNASVLSHDIPKSEQAHRFAIVQHSSRSHAYSSPERVQDTHNYNN